MKKILFVITLISLSLSASALSRSKVREYARFLSDRMAYELRLTNGQYNDCYEINYDFIAAAGDLLDDVVYGYSAATDNYYIYLDYRNEDLSYVLTSSQYDRFLSTDCFYRPFCIYDGYWAFRPYMVYDNRTYFYLSVPLGYSSYRGAHARIHFNGGFYVGRYNHGPRHDFVSIRRHQHFADYHRRDFGPVRSGHVGVRPSGGRAHRAEPAPNKRPVSGARIERRATQTRPDVRPDNKRKQGNEAPSNRSERKQEVRPERNNNTPARSEVRPERSQNNPSGRSSTPQTKQEQPQQNQRQGGGGVARRGRG